MDKLCQKLKAKATEDLAALESVQTHERLRCGYYRGSIHTLETSGLDAEFPADPSADD